MRIDNGGTSYQWHQHDDLDSSVYLAQESKEKQDISVYHLLVLKHIFAFNVD